ncbi:MAG TPA: phosphosulfolactate synthase [Thermoplasmata archaeon]|nr:phosphosulfolactate synthase [Thermoplasmata archaeon]
MRSKNAFFPAEVPRVERPRKTGITHVLDRLQGLHPEELRYLSPYFDIAKIGWGLPLLLPREKVRERVHLYHEVGVEVCTGGTLLEYAVAHDRATQMMDEAKALGFDLIEISSGIIELSFAQIERLAEAVRKRGLEFFIEVGKKDPQHQLSLKETNAQVAHARTVGPRRVIIESRESGRGVGIYDSDGAIKWDWVRSILSEHPAEELILEAPQEVQQVQLLRELGAEVNLGNVALGSVAPLASERLGLRGETFGMIRHARAISGPPAAKFLYFLLETYRGLDQTQLAHMSRLPRRTVQSALESLRRQGLVQETISLHDSRRREYRLA